MGDWNLPSSPKRLEHLSGGVRGAEHLRAAISPPHLPRQLGWMTPQLYAESSIRFLHFTAPGSAAGPRCSSPANAHQTQTSPRKAKQGVGPEAERPPPPAMPIQCSLASWPYPGLSLSLGDGSVGLGTYHLLNTGSVPVAIPQSHCGARRPASSYKRTGADVPASSSIPQVPQHCLSRQQMGLVY